MKKLITLCILLTTFAFAGSPEERCDARMKALVKAMDTNKDITYVFIALIKMTALANPKQTEDEVALFVTSKIWEQCIKNEKTKTEI
jgi:hypothetical protein